MEPKNIQLVDRYEYILKLCTWKNVLDLWCVDHDFLVHSEDKDHPWLHKNIKSVADTLLWVDFLEEDIALMTKSGFTAVQANVENMDLWKTFDVIVAGEIIEHLQNTWLFLQSCKKHMKKDSLLIITTPNPFYYLHQYQILRFWKPIIHEEHTCYFDPQTLGYLAELNWFIVEEVYFTKLYKKWHRYVSWFTYLRRYWSQWFIITLKTKPE